MERIASKQAGNPMVKTTRRGFIGGAAAFAPFAARLWATEAEVPLLKIGVMTDTHVGTTKESCSRARLAYEMFRDMDVDLIANVGDVADHHYPTGYVAYREMVDETFAQVPAERRPKELFVYAWHDAYAYKDHPREAAAKDSPEAFADMERLIGAWAPFARRDAFGDFWMRESERPASVTQSFNAAYFDEGEAYRMVVTAATSSRCLY